MSIWELFLYLYLGAGFLYALYIWLFQSDPWYVFPVNMLGGPVFFVAYVVSAFREQRPEVKNYFKNKKAVVFDLDGTIVDTVKTWVAAIDAVLKAVGAPYVEKNYPDGISVYEKWEVLVDSGQVQTQFSIQELTDHTKREFIQMTSEIDVRSGFWELVKKLKQEKNLKLGLASNTDRDVVDVVLKRVDATTVFDFVIGGDEVKQRKPHPEMYKKAATSLGVKVSEMVIFEDSLAGAEAAVAAGGDVIAIWDGSVPQDHYPKEIKLFLPDFDGVADWVDVTLEEQIQEALKTEVAQTPTAVQ